MKRLLFALLIALPAFSQQAVQRDLSCTAAGASTTTYTCSIAVAPSGYVTNQQYMFVADVANTASSTINFNTLGAKTIKKLDAGTKINLAANDIGAGMRVFLVYDATDMVLTTPPGNSASDNTTVNNVTINNGRCNKCILNGTEQRTVQAFVLGPAETTSTGNGKYFFVVPATLNSNDLTAVRGQVLTAGTTGTTTVALTRCVTAATGNACSGTTAQMLSTSMTIDSGENSTATAATPPVINAANATVTTGQIIRIDISAVNTTPALGLIISMDFTAP